MSITKLNCMELKDTRYSVYPYDGYNLEEMLGKFYEAIKECNDLSFSLQEFNTWLIDTGLIEEVEKQLTKVDWDNIDIINQIKDELNKINVRFDDYATIEQLGNYTTIEQLGNYATTTYVDNKYDMLFQSVSNGKELLASAITDKGVVTLATDSFEVMANNIRKITSGGGEPTTPITISHINDMGVSSGEVFNITYTTNVDVVKHEMTFDGGASYHIIHPSGDKNGYIYEHEAITETSYPHQRKIRVTDSNDNTATSNIFNITVNAASGGGEPTTPITIGNISDMAVTSGKVFNITYTTNVEAVKHEMSFDDGTTYHVIYPTGDKNGYIYEHEAITETSYPHQRKIRVTDSNDNIATSNTFNINVTAMSPFLASMYGNPRVVASYPSGIQFPPINAHEDLIQPNGVNTTDSWKYGTRINNNPREDWTRVGWWGQVYRQEGYGYDPDNVAVEVKNAKLWGWNGSSWVLIHDVNFTSTNTIFYVENFANDQNNHFASNKKVDGSKNVTIKFDSTNSGYMFHPYSGKVSANNYGLPKPYYYCSTMSARLVKWDSSGADNLDSAKLCFNVGGDFWHTTHETWQPDWSANGEYAQGQFIKCTREWRTAYCTNVPEGWTNGFPSI